MKKENINNYKIIENINSQDIITEIPRDSTREKFCSKNMERNNKKRITIIEHHREKHFRRIILIFQRDQL